MPRSSVILAALVAGTIALPVYQPQSPVASSVPETHDWPLFGGLISIASAKETSTSAQKPYVTLNLNPNNSPSSSAADPPAKPAVPVSQPPPPAKKPNRESDSVFDSATTNLANAPDWLFPFLGFSNPFKAPKSTSDPFEDDGYRGPSTSSAASPPSAADAKCAAANDGDTTKCKSPFWWLGSQAKPDPSTTSTTSASGGKTGSGSASADDDLWDDGPKTPPGISSVPAGYSVTNPLGADGGWQNGR